MGCELSIGIIGAGVVVRERHIPAVLVQRGVRIAWISDPLPEARARVQERHRVRTVEHPGDLLSGTDVVLIATPPATHAAWVVEALEAGCHVLCEKPLALDPADCRRIVDAASAAGLVVTVGFNLRHHPAAQALRRAVREGTLGRPVLVRSCSSSPGRPGATGWVGDGRQGGDVLWEVGSHHADLWRFVLGAEIVEATGHAETDMAVLSARTDDGTPISSIIAWGAGPENDIAVLGDRARARAAFYGADPVIVTRNDATGAELGERLRSGAMMLGAAPRMVRAARRGGAFQATYAAEWTAFLGTVREGQPNPCPPEAGLAATEVVRMLRAECGSRSMPAAHIP